MRFETNQVDEFKCMSVRLLTMTMHLVDVKWDNDDQDDGDDDNNNIGRSHLALARVYAENKILLGTTQKKNWSQTTKNY